MLADSFSKMIDGQTFLRHKNVYLSNDMTMSEVNGVKKGEQLQLTKPFKINHGDDDDEDNKDGSSNYMICHADLGDGVHE